MKKYVKAQVVAKNNPQGSYAAGCPEKGAGSTLVGGGQQCKNCERTR